MASLSVLGPGGVGGFLAAALHRAGGHVTVIAREDTAAEITRHGINVSSVRLGDFNALVPASAELTEDGTTLIVATKAAGLEASLARVTAIPDLVVPLLNGLDHMDILRGRFGPERVAAGTIRIESDRPRAAQIVQTSPFLRVDLAAAHARARERLGALAQTLGKAQVPAEVHDSEKQILWSKLVRLNALACTTSAADRPIGFIRSDPGWRAALVACIDEAAAVANADGARIDPAARLAELDDAHAGLGSSMQRDIAAGREPELDAIAGSVLRAGRRLGMQCPTITRLSAAIAQRAGVAAPRV